MKQYTIKELKRMGITKQRALLRDLNKVANTKATRLIKAGYSGAMTRPPIVNASKVPKEELVRSIEELQIYNRSQLSTVKGMNEFVKKTLDTLHDHKYDFVNKSNLEDFGKFMNKVRVIHGDKAFPSNAVATMYDNMERLGISPRVVETKFKQFLASQEGIVDLLVTMETMKLPEDRVRISSTEVYSQMENLGLI